MSQEKSSAKLKRSNYWATVIYLDSAPSDWLTILQDYKTPAFVSPYHDKDINADNSPKKPHYHVMLLFDSLKSDEQAKEIFTAIGGVGCERICSLRGYARYLCHLDNPDKAQYDVGDVLALYGAEFIGTIGQVSDKYICIREMIDFCRTEGITAYCILFDYAAVNRDDWFRCLCDNGSYVMEKYLKSLSWLKDNPNKR